MDYICGIPLTTLGLVIAGFDLILSVFLAISIFLAIVNLDELTESLLEQVINPTVVESVKIFVPFFAYISFILAIGLLFASGLLILGILSRHHRYMAPWLTVSSLFIFIGLFEIYCNLITLKVINVHWIIFTGLRGPMFCLIYVLYKKMHDEHRSDA